MHVPRFVLYVPALIVLIASAASADAVDEAAALYAEGQALLAEGEFDQALQRYRAAAVAHPDELNYDVQAAILKRVIGMRGALDRLSGGPKWRPTMQALYAYYMENGIHSEALSAAQALHAAESSVESAVRIARAQLALGTNVDAARTLQRYSREELGAAARVVLGIALAREDLHREARDVAAIARPTEQLGADILFDLARLHALLGDSQEALSALTLCFERTPPSRLTTVRQRARDHRDLVGLRDDSGFARALATASTVNESKCSGGSDCGSCPSRASCTSDDTEQKNEKN